MVSRILARNGYLLQVSMPIEKFHHHLADGDIVVYAGLHYAAEAAVGPLLALLTGALMARRTEAIS